MPNKLNWLSAGYYLSRTPTLPIGTLLQLTDESGAGLQDLWEKGPLAEAVFVASAGLYTQIQQHLAAKAWPLPPSLLRPLLKYALRMSTRATPFGLMAGCAPGKLAESTQVRLLPATDRPQQHRRLDMGYVAKLVEHLNADPLIRPQLQFFTNNSLYTVGNEVRYVDSSPIDQNYFMSAVINSPYLETLLDLAQSGATVTQLIESITNDEIDADTAGQFVGTLIDQRLLISELEPVLTGPPVLATLSTKLGRLSGTASLVDAIQRIEQLLTSAQSAMAVHQQLAGLLDPYLPTPTDNLIQTDLFLGTSSNQLGQRAVNTILTELAELLPLNQAAPPSDLHKFAKRFWNRYEQREVPLSEVLDGDVGIGYGNTINGQTAYTPLVNGLLLPEQTSQTATLSWGPFEQLALSKFTQAMQNQGQSVAITPQELAEFKLQPTPHLPASFYIFGSLLAQNHAAIDQGDFRFSLLTATGPSAATLLGRFCAYSPQLTQQLRQSLRQEADQQPDCLFAEIVHWPHDRAGNVLVRPALRDYEIPYNSPASVDQHHQLPVSDLLVSVTPDGRVRLRSKRLGKQVIPRLANAHNYKHGLSTYRFLADLAQQDHRLNIEWSWGPLASQPFLPRVTYKHLILSRASWNLPIQQLPTHSAQALAHYLQNQHHLPRWVALSQGDNELLIDLEAAATQQLLLEEAKRATTLRLVEWLATPEACFVEGEPEERFVQELILPAYYQPTAVTQPLAKPWAKPVGMSDQPIQEPTRSFSPGSEWLYVKLYTGVHSADQLLTNLIQPLLEDLHHQQQIEQAFFIRYYDPDFHLRLRLQSHQPGFIAPLLGQLNERIAPFQQAGTVFRLQLDTYQRELERYGRATMALSEQLFSADSRAALAYLRAETQPEERWLFALQSCHRLLTDFGLLLPQRVKLMQALQTQFLAEHQADASFRRQLNERYRAQQGPIEAALSEDSPWLIQRSSVVQPLAEAISLLSGQAGEPGLGSLLSSYLHMSLNRLFTAKHRLQELVVYHYLARYYESQLARQTAAQKVRAV